MGKPGSFFKKLKAKQKREASRQRRGTKGAAKEERRHKHNERVEYYAAKREAEELAAVSSSSEDEASIGSEEERWRGEKKLRRLRALLGVAPDTLRRRQKRVRENTPDTEAAALRGDGEDEHFDAMDAVALKLISPPSNAPKQDVVPETSDGNAAGSSDEGDGSDDWEAYLGCRPRSADGSSSTDDEEGLLADEEDDEEGLLVDEEDDGEGLLADEEDDEGEANPLFDLLDDNDDNLPSALSVAEGEEEEEEESKEEVYVEDDADDASSSSSKTSRESSRAHRASQREEKARLSRALLPQFTLGTTSTETLLKSNVLTSVRDPWYVKYHLDQHGEVDQSPLQLVEIPPHALEALTHSNDPLIVAAEEEESRATARGSCHDEAAAADRRIAKGGPPHATDVLRVSAAEYRGICPSNISVAASAHARKYMLHPPFAVGCEAATQRGEGVKQPAFVHETLWVKWVAYRQAIAPLPVLTVEEHGLLDLLQGYADVLDCTRCWPNSASRREIFLLHLLNHWFKARAVVAAHDRVLEAHRATQRARRRERAARGGGAGKARQASDKVSPRAPAATGDTDLELRDRGFGKTRLLVVLPMRNQAYRYVHDIVRILGADADRCSKLQTFSEDFSEVQEAVDPTFKRRPKDYQRQFEGNIDDSFCVGLRLEPDRVHVYAHPLNSDIVICSPLGLRRRLDKSGDVLVSLSSVEVCVVDEAHVLLQQNWQHAAAVLALLNKRPTDTTHGLSDLRRVYAWALEGHSGRHRQTIIATNISHATFFSVLRALRNNSGRLLLQHREEEGVLPRVLVPVRQNFVRVEIATSLEDVDDKRFEFFTTHLYATKIHALVERDVRTIIFVPSYLQFVRLRNYMYREYRESFAAISEYSSIKQQRRALGQFTDLERPLLLMTERFYFFKRYFVKLAEVLVFYSPPTVPEFYYTLLNHLAATSPNALAMTVYTRYDTHELNRIVGTKRLGHLLERESGVFSFITA